MLRFVSFPYSPYRNAALAAAGFVLGVGVTVASFDIGRGAEREPSVRAPLGSAEQTAPSSMRAFALSVIDGDTLEARIAVFPGQEIVTRIRLAGVDAPERRGRCPAERQAADAATQALAKLVDGRPLTLAGVRGDKYFGRVLARVSTADGGDVADALIAGGHGRPYDGGRREGWC